MVVVVVALSLDDPVVVELSDEPLPFWVVVVVSDGPDPVVVVVVVEVPVVVAPDGAAVVFAAAMVKLCSDPVALAYTEPASTPEIKVHVPALK